MEGWGSDILVGLGTQGGWEWRVGVSGGRNGTGQAWDSPRRSEGWMLRTMNLLPAMLPHPSLNSSCD